MGPGWGQRLLRALFLPYYSLVAVLLPIRHRLLEILHQVQGLPLVSLRLRIQSPLAWGSALLRSLGIQGTDQWARFTCPEMPSPRRCLLKARREPSRHHGLAPPQHITFTFMQERSTKCPWPRS